MPIKKKSTMKEFVFKPITRMTQIQKMKAHQGFMRKIMIPVCKTCRYILSDGKNNKCSIGRFAVKPGDTCAKYEQWYMPYVNVKIKTAKPSNKNQLERCRERALKEMEGKL